MDNHLDLLLSELNNLISAGKFELALSQMKSWLDGLASDFRLHGRVFSSNDLDQLCLKIGQCVLGNRVKRNNGNSVNCSAVFIASELYLTGGHTKVLKDYIRALKRLDMKVLVIDPADKVNDFQIIEYFADLPAEIRFSPKFTSLLTKLEWLIENLILLDAKEIYLFNHANDPVAVAAMQVELVPSPIFVHHCDHTFTLGIHIPNSRHLDFRERGFDNCRNNLGITNNTIYPLVAPDLGCPPADERFFANGKLHTCTSGSYKFEAPYAFHLATELPKWLKTTGGIHTHIGELSAETTNTIRNMLNRYGISQDNFKVIPFVQSLWTGLISEQIDLYIDSFPIGGAHSIVEAMGAGIPITVHHNYVTPMWSNVGYVYPEAKVWQQPIELEHWLAQLDKKTLSSQSKLARQYYLTHHHPDQLPQALSKTEKEFRTEPGKPQAPVYETNSLRAFMDQFLPIPLTPKRHKELLSQFLACLSIGSVSGIEIDILLKDYLSPSDFNLFTDLIAEIKSKSKAIDILDDIHPILNDRGIVDLERFTKFLYQTATINGNGNKSKQIALSPKIKAKLLYYRLKSKWQSLIKVD